MMTCIEGVMMEGSATGFTGMNRIFPNFSPAAWTDGSPVGLRGALPAAAPRAPETRKERVARLKSEVESGRYFVSSDELAECLMKSMMRAG